MPACAGMTGRQKSGAYFGAFGEIATVWVVDRKNGGWPPALPGLSAAQSRVIFDGWFEKGDSRFRGNDGGFAGMTSERFWA